MTEYEISSADDREQFTTLIVKHQRELYLYIWSLMYRDDDAQDVLQETNLALWRDLERVSRVDDFRSWACRVAYNQVLAYRKRQSRDRLRFDDSLMSQLASESLKQDEQADDYKLALRLCAKKLPPKSRQLLVFRYQTLRSIGAIAKRLGCSAASVSQSLLRIRAGLLKCIRDTLAKEDLDRRERS